MYGSVPCFPPPPSRVCACACRELWIPENLAEFKSEKMTEKTGGNLTGRQKQYLRFKKKYKPNLGAE